MPGPLMAESTKLENLAVVAVLAASITAVVWMAADEMADRGAAESPEIVLTPCVTEDQQTDCYWDADVRGNGAGTSFVVIDGELYQSTNTPTGEDR